MLIVVSTILSSFIAAYVIQLYVRRAEYQDENIDDIRMDAGGGSESLEDEYASRVPKASDRGSTKKGAKGVPMAGAGGGSHAYGRQNATSGYGFN